MSNRVLSEKQSQNNRLMEDLTSNKLYTSLIREYFAEYKVKKTAEKDK